jgi:cobalt-zinc-cadmium efflux system outer membrane protein
MKSWIFFASIWLTAATVMTPSQATEFAQAVAPLAFPAQPAPVELTPEDRSQGLIESDPRVVQARHALEAARHRAEGLAAGPYEWTVQALAQRRSFRDGAPASDEWSAGLERTVRIGGKAELDRQLGDIQVRLAQAQLSQARREAARELLDLSLNWLAADRTRLLWTEQLAFAQSNLNAAGVRRRAGDASQLEQNVARADLAEVQRQLSVAANEEAKARARLRARFGQLDLQPVALSAPLPLEPDGTLWRDRILAVSDVLRTAQAELRRAELTASRAGADRLADPTIGVHAGSEARGSERIVGLTLSIPLGGTYRNAQLREALAQVEVARAAADRSRLELDADIAESLTEASGSLERWKFAEQARAATQENAQLAQRAYSLGESDVQAVLLARRQSVDAALGAAHARADALRARYRLLVDAHLIWGLQHQWPR